MSESIPPPPGSTSPLAFPGAILAGRYRLEEIVGHGGMGAVWRATHTGLGEPVAVKLVSAHFVRSTEALRRFDTEAKSAARLRSRHVPQVFDNGVLDDGTPFLVMELLHGESLAARVNRLGPTPLPETVSILEQCCRALSRAHSLGITHRDIKPENVYLAQSVDDDSYIVKVLDFGIAKVTSSLTDDGRSSTRTGTLLGTPLYMSPEQARGLRSIDFRTDLYSLGLVTFTMLTGRLPFSGETLGELLLQICVEPLPSLRAITPWLPPSVDQWFQKACARLPEDRYGSAQALVEALRVAAAISSAGQSELIAGGRPGVSPAYGSSTGSAGRALSATPAGTLAAPSTTAGTSLVSQSATHRRPLWILIAVTVVGLAAVPVVALMMRRGHEPGSAPSAQVAALPSAPARAIPETEGGPAVLSISPLADSPASVVAPMPKPPGAPSMEGRPPTTASAHLVARPAPPAASAKPPSAPPPTNKPRGPIDLGY
jgi:serine/threonine protein kinase